MKRRALWHLACSGGLGAWRELLESEIHTPPDFLGFAQDVARRLGETPPIPESREDMIEVARDTLRPLLASPDAELRARVIDLTARLPKDLIEADWKTEALSAAAIRQNDRLLLILSEASMDSEWVKTEIAHARQKELKQGRQVLFPIRLVDFEAIRRWRCFDADTGKDSAREIREYFIPDFSNWKDHDAYQKAFERLLKDRKAEGKERAGPGGKALASQ